MKPRAWSRPAAYLLAFMALSLGVGSLGFRSALASYLAPAATPPYGTGSGSMEAGTAW